MTISLTKLFESYLNNEEAIKLALLGSCALDSTDMEAKGYELIGDTSEFHLYEKNYPAGFRNHRVNVRFKYYFHRDSAIGDAIEVGAGVRLISALKIYKKIRGVEKIKDGNVEIYFSAEKQDGALIFDDSIVVRFGKRSVRGHYSVLGVESDADKTGMHKCFATGPIRATMDRFDKKSFHVTRRTSPPLYRLIDFYCRF